MELTVYRRTLLNAVEVAGTEKRLAEFLGASASEVRSWAMGQAIPPVKTLLLLADIVSANSLTAPPALQRVLAGVRGGARP